MCTNDEKNFPILIENQVVGDVCPPSPITTQKPDTKEVDAAQECAAVVPEFPVEDLLKNLRQTSCSRVTEDGMWQHDATSEKPMVKETVELVDVTTNASTQRGDNMSVDPQLHLLDFQLRHILKSSPSARDEGSSAAADVPGAKTKNAIEGSPSRSFAHSRSVLSQPAAGRDHNLPPVDPQCSRKPPHSGSVRCEPADWQMSSGRSDGIEHCGGVAHTEASRGRSSRSVERGRRPSYGRKDVNEDCTAQPPDDKGDMKKLSIDAAASGGITFGGVEELSHANVHVEDLPTTNIYLDDHATKAAPYTIASQFYSLGSEADDDDGSEGAPDKKMDDDRTCNISPSVCHTADKPRRPATLTRQTLSAEEKPTEQSCHQHDSVWRQCSANMQFTGSTVVSRAVSANGPLTADAIPRPKFSVRSPSSPARLASDVVIDSTPRQITVEPANKQRVVSNVSPSQDNCVPAAPLAAQEPDGSEANSASDVEAGVFALPFGNVVAQKLATLNVKSEPRGTADGESPRMSCEVTDGPGNTGQRSDISDRMSSVSAELAGITSSVIVSSCQQARQTNMFTKPTADFPNLANTSKIVPMAVAKKIADCLDVSLGSDKELKEIMRNGMPAVDKVDRTMSGAPMSRFAVVSKTVTEHSESCGKVPNSATGTLEPVAVNVGSISVPSVPDSVPANPWTMSDVQRIHCSAAVQPCLSSMSQCRRDDVSDTGSVVLVKTESFSSPEHLPRPPSGRVSKKAAIANRARYVPSDRISEILFQCNTRDSYVLYSTERRRRSKRPCQRQNGVCASPPPTVRA